MIEKSKLKKIIPVLLILAIAGGVVYALLQRERTKSAGRTFYGNVDIRQVQMAFQSSGRIKDMHVREGAQVKAGDLVAELDPVYYQAGMNRARAEVNAQKEVVARLLAGSRPEEIAEAKARVTAAKAVLGDAKQKQGRAEKLAKDNYVSQQELDSAETAVDTAKANLKAVQQVAELAVKGPREEDIAGAQAQLKAYQAALASAKQQLKDTKLYAPTNGVIQNRILEVGDMASPQVPVYTLALADPVWVRAYVPEPDLGKVSEGMTATVTTDSFPGKKYNGWVGYISPTAEFTPKQIETTDLRTRLVYQIRVFVRNPENELRLGMPATVQLDAVPAQEK